MVAGRKISEFQNRRRQNAVEARIGADADRFVVLTLAWAVAQIVQVWWEAAESS